MNRPFTITCGTQRPRHAASFRGAKTTMGKMMNNVAKGTRGEIREGDVVVLVAECSSLGWFTVDSPATTSTREYVENDLGIKWADWYAMSLADRVAAITGRPAPAYLALPAGPARLAAFLQAAGR